MGRTFLYILFLMIALPSTAPIYKYTDANGHTVYSDHSPDGVQAQPVELPPLNRVEPQAPSAPPAPVSENLSLHADAFDNIQLAGLPTEEALRANNGTFTVNVLIKPRLRPPHQLRLVLDDEPYGQPSNVPILQLVNVDRGEHRLAVQVIDGQTVIQQSAPVPLSVQRVHKP